MDAIFEDHYHRLEETHWWFLARRDMIMRLLECVPHDAAILDVGCSGGVLLAALQQQGYRCVYGIDISETAIARCRQRGISNAAVADAQAVPFSDAFFDVVIASDLLEHIPHVHRALSEWRRVVKPEGLLIVFVPAFQWLWSSHDEMNDHVKRYRRHELVSELQQHDVHMMRSGYWNIALLLPVALMRFGERLLSLLGRRGSGQLRTISPLCNAMLARLLRVENAIIAAGMRFPWGVSVFAVARAKS